MAARSKSRRQRLQGEEFKAMTLPEPLGEMIIVAVGVIFMALALSFAWHAFLSPTRRKRNKFETQPFIVRGANDAEMDEINAAIRREWHGKQRLKVLVVAFLVLSFSTVDAKPKKFLHLDGYTAQNTFCIETLAGWYRGKTVWFVWQTDRCRPRARVPESGNRVVVPVERLDNILDEGNLIVVYPR